MTWKNEQIAAARTASVHTSRWRDLPDSLIVAIMDSARDALAAAGGTMTAEGFADALRELKETIEIARDMENFREDDLLRLWQIGQHAAAQGAKVAALTAWLADLTEVLTGERPVGAGVMPSTTLDAARALQAKVAALRDELRAYMNLGVEAAQVLAECGGFLGEGLLAGAQRVVAKVAVLEADAETLKATIRADRDCDRRLLTELGGSGESLRGAVLRVMRERDDARAEIATLRVSLAERQHSLEQMNDSARSEVGELRAELASLKPSGQVADDVETLRGVIALHQHNDVGQKTEGNAALSRLAALAQRGQGTVETPTPDVPAEVPHSLSHAMTEQGGTLPGPCVVREEGVPNPCEDGTCKHQDSALPAYDQGLTTGYDNGIEAMRAACWTTVERVLESLGWAQENGHLRNQFKAAIEGATP